LFSWGPSLSRSGVVETITPQHVLHLRYISTFLCASFGLEHSTVHWGRLSRERSSVGMVPGGSGYECGKWCNGLVVVHPRWWRRGWRAREKDKRADLGNGGAGWPATTGREVGNARKMETIAANHQQANGACPPRP
jgi:hypothetical protein